MQRIGRGRPRIEPWCALSSPQGLQDATTLQPLKGLGVLMWLYRGDSPLSPDYSIFPLQGQPVGKMMSKDSLSAMYGFFLMTDLG